MTQELNTKRQRFNFSHTCESKCMKQECNLTEQLAGVDRILSSRNEWKNQLQQHTEQTFSCLQWNAENKLYTQTCYMSGNQWKALDSVQIFFFFLLHSGAQHHQNQF